MEQQFGQTQVLKACPVCARLFDHAASVCTVDGYELVTQVEEDPLIGTWLLDRYVILSVIGAGGWARVYKARHLTLGTLVAIKTLHTHFMSNREKVQRFEQEAKAACGLRHENIAAVYDFGTLPNGQPFIIMDLLEGRSLQNLLEAEHVMDPARGVHIFKQICAGLAAAHDHGIVHRDIKPSNIVLLPDTDRGELVKLFDFGLAKLKMEDGTSLNQFTKTGETVGTPAYMSPEQCQGWKLDHRTDIYSLGCVMYECLTGVRAFSGTTMYESMSKHVLEVAAPFHEVAPNLRIAGELEDIVFKALEKDPRRRYNSARKLLTDLQTYEENAATGNAKGNWQPMAIKRPMRSLQRTAHKYRRTAVLVGTTLVLLAASSMLVYQGWRGYDPSQMSLPDRWLYFMEHGTQALNGGQYQSALEYLNQSVKVADNFSVSERKRISLANVALLYHILNESDKEKASAAQLLDLGQPAAAQPVFDQQLKPGESELLSSMLDTVTRSHPVDKRQLQLLAQRINEAAAVTPSAQVLPLLEKNSKTIKQYMGEGSEAYALASERLAVAYSLNNQHDQALETWLAALPVLKKALKQSDPHYAQILGAAALELERYDRLAEAEHYLSEAVQAGTGDDALENRANLMSALALVYEREGKDKEAYDQWKSVARLFDGAGNYDNADTAVLELVYCGNRMRTNAATQEYLTSRRDALINQYGRLYPGVAAYALALGELDLIQGQLEEAQKCAKQALDIRQLSRDPHLFTVRRALDLLTRIYMAQHKYEQALPMQVELLATAQRNAAADNDKGVLLAAYARLAYLHSKLAQKEQAAQDVKQFKAVLASLEPQASGYDCTRAINATFGALDKLGLQRSDYDQLERLLKAQTTVKAADGRVDSVPTPAIDGALAVIYALSDRPSDAIAQGQLATTQIEKHYNVSPWRAGMIYRNYASSLRSMGKNEEAQHAEDSALRYPSESI